MSTDKALAAENAAIFAYSRIGLALGEADRKEARAAEAVHRARRDALVGILPSPAPAAVAYELPFPVTDKASAMKLAIHVEDGVAATWRAALKTATAETRKTVLDAYTDASVRTTRWRRLAGITPVISTFPGRPN